MRSIGAGPDGEQRLVLGFDAGCAKCSNVELQIREQVGDEIEVLSLSDYLVQDWRERALGEDAPWAPTLLEVSGAGVEGGPAGGWGPIWRAASARPPHGGSCKFWASTISCPRRLAWRGSRG